MLIRRITTNTTWKLLSSSLSNFFDWTPPPMKNYSPPESPCIVPPPSVPLSHLDRPATTTPHHSVTMSCDGGAAYCPPSDSRWSISYCCCTVVSFGSWSLLQSSRCHPRSPLWWRTWSWSRTGRWDRLRRWE